MLLTLFMGGLAARIRALRLSRRTRSELCRSPHSLRLELGYAYSSERAAAILAQASDHGWQRESREMYGC